jgi:hypothetical protein
MTCPVWSPLWTIPYVGTEFLFNIRHVFENNFCHRSAMDSPIRLCGEPRLRFGVRLSDDCYRSVALWTEGTVIGESCRSQINSDTAPVVQSPRFNGFSRDKILIFIRPALWHIHCCEKGHGYE